jgi:hypothetical protein
LTFLSKSYWQKPSKLQLWPGGQSAGKSGRHCAQMLIAGQKKQAWMLAQKGRPAGQLLPASVGSSCESGTQGIAHWLLPKRFTHCHPPDGQSALLRQKPQNPWVQLGA